MKSIAKLFVTYIVIGVACTAGEQLWYNVLEQRVHKLINKVKNLKRRES